MDKILSARLDETAIGELDRVSRRFGMTKKDFLESAIRLRARQLEAEHGADIWQETSGAWSRRESPETTLRRSRRAFRKGFERNQE